MVWNPKVTTMSANVGLGAKLPFVKRQWTVLAKLFACGLDLGAQISVPLLALSGWHPDSETMCELPLEEHC